MRYYITKFYIFIAVLFAMTPIGTVSGLYNAVTSPIQTAQGLANAVSHPIDTATSIYDGVTTTWNSGPRGQGQLIGDALIFAASAGATKSIATAGRGVSIAEKSSELRTVTSWASRGIAPDLAPGRWVQLGEATQWNFWKTGLSGPKVHSSPLKLESSNVPFSNSITGQIPASSLQWPSGWEKIKGIFGQRQIKGGIE